jgi:peptidoglycan hydrolase-like protein with peptidoglycan-binding domain
VLIDSNLVIYLQKIRDHFGKPVSITSGYRTAAYNKRIGGKPASMHVKGQAADIQIFGVSPVLVGLYAESIGAGGIGLYSYGTYTGFVHVDSRANKYRWLTISRYGAYTAISKILPTIYHGGKDNAENAVKIAQRRLEINPDGKFGSGTKTVVMTYQRNHGLKPDGVIGPKTWAMMFS